MRKLKLSQGQVALIDSKDFRELSNWKWTFMKHTVPVDGGYAYRKSGTTSVLLHRQIMNPSKGMVIDHINKRGLDNRRKNLRICTYTQSRYATGGNKVSSSVYKGVHWCNTSDRWIARCRIDDKLNYLGSFKIEREAATAYDRFAKRYHGRFVELNLV